MINFRNDYCGIGHEKILDALIKYKNKTYVGYGLDERSKNAELLIKKEIDNNSADIHFLPGGTICNKIVISHLLKPYEAVISADSGHINVHETGAIEEAGHKILSFNNTNGKLTCEDILKVLDEHTNEHIPYRSLADRLLALKLHADNAKVNAISKHNPKTDNFFFIFNLLNRLFRLFLNFTETPFHYIQQTKSANCW